MLEPSARYSAGGVGGGGGGTSQSALQIDTHHGGLETAVDLSRKATSENEVGGSRSAPGDLEADQEDSEDEAPLDLKVRPRTGSCNSSSSVLTGGGGNGAVNPPLFLSDIQRAEQSMPSLQQRAELLRIAEAMHTNNPSRNSGGLPLPPNMRSSSHEREMPSESACSLCGADTQSPDFKPAEHGENLCGRGTLSCPLCAKTFTLWSHYEAHKKCHQKLKQRQYPCQTCGKVFTSASNRNMHQRIHKGVRPFQCTPCGVFFRQKAHLQKHQKTQGHIQATELYEKKKREGLLTASNEDTNSSSGKGSSPPLNQLRPDSVNSNGSSNLSLVADSTSPNSTGIIGATLLDSSLSPASSCKLKSSPKRKQAKPSQLVMSENNNEDMGSSGTGLSHNGHGGEEEDDDEEEEDCRVSTSEDKLNAFIDFNDLSHGYDCNQCTFASHELATLKDHVREEHMALEREDKLKCKECQITFSKEFNLRIHNRKHETSSQFLPCDHCEQVFKVPNKLIKHMEAIHSVCPTCGDRQEDKASLLRHMEDVHDEAGSRKGFHTNLLQFTPLMSHLSSPKAASLSLENRMAKKRKVDSLAEVIRQKQEAKVMMTSVTSPRPTLDSHLRQRSKSPVAARLTGSIIGGQPNNHQHHHHLPVVPTSLSQAISASFLHLQPQPLSKLNPDLLQHHKRSENNNVLSSLKLPPSIRLPTKPVAGLTPPSSPPPTQIRGEVSVTIMGAANSGDESDSEPAGLDLSIGKRRRESDEHEVSTTASGVGDRLPHPHDLYGRLPIPPHPAPHHLPFPFLPPPLGSIPPGTDPALAEHLLKLAALHNRGGVLVPPPPPPPPHDMPKPPTTSPYTVLSAMLGHPPPPHYPTVFPGMSSVFPVGHIPTTQTSLSIKEELEPRIGSSSSSASEKKPFVCNFCRKEFGHLSSLESHMDHMHSGDAKHSCESCGKSFSSKSNLTAHRKIHSGERPFECVVCHKRFRQKAHLQKHETTHSSATPYQCTVCDKAFGHISNLNTHMATHSNVRPYQCADCGKSYKDSASFKRHRLGHTGERPYSCDYCEDTFIDSKAVRRHRELLHPNEEPPKHLEDEEEVDDDEDSTTIALVTPSTSAYSSFESGKTDHPDEEEEIEVEKEMEEEEEDDEDQS